MSTMRSQRGAAGRPALIAIVVLVLALYVVFRSCTVVVGAGQRGVVFSKSGGVRPGALGEGIHFIVPLIWEVKLYDVRSQTYTLGSQPTGAELQGGEPVDALSSDGQKVGLHVSVRFRLKPDEVWQVHRDIGEDYVVKIIKPQVRSDARTVVAAYPGIDVYSKERYTLQEKLQERLAEKLADRHIVVEEVLVRDITFSPQFQQAIEQKQIAQQDALRMEYVVRKQKEEKKQTVILAKGEAEAIKLKGHALGSYPEIVQWEYVNNLPDDINVVVTDAQTIISMTDLFQKRARQPEAQQQPAAGQAAP